ncbi:MAG: hypothetical protein LUC29_01470 [Acidaminococcaceae bacterium]|nr:hypothetical protein [Acidaminococcaceae bacterium]
MEEIRIFLLQTPLHIDRIKHLQAEVPVLGNSEFLQESDDIFAVAALVRRQQAGFAVGEKQLVAVIAEVAGSDKIIVGVRQVHGYLLVDPGLCHIQDGKHADGMTVIRRFDHIDDAFQVTAAVILRHTDKTFYFLPGDALSKFFQQRRIEKFTEEKLLFLRVFDQ